MKTTLMNSSITLLTYKRQKLGKICMTTERYLSTLIIQLLVEQIWKKCWIRLFWEENARKCITSKGKVATRGAQTSEVKETPVGMNIVLTWVKKKQHGDKVLEWEDKKTTGLFSPVQFTSAPISLVSNLLNYFLL